MTPAERARQIDSEEFEAECTAIRQRALAYATNCRKIEAVKLKAWLNEEKKPRARTVRCGLMRHHQSAIEAASRANVAKAKRLHAFGQSLSLRGWAEETGLSEGTIRSRLKYGWTLEEALSRDVQVHCRSTPGVSSDFAPLEGTGAGSTAQETPNLTFSQEAAE
jgi:hypothetical protein